MTLCIGIPSPSYKKVRKLNELKISELYTASRSDKQCILQIPQANVEISATDMVIIKVSQHSARDAEHKHNGDRLYERHLTTLTYLFPPHYLTECLKWGHFQVPRVRLLRVGVMNSMTATAPFKFRPRLVKIKHGYVYRSPKLCQINKIQLLVRFLRSIKVMVIRSDTKPITRKTNPNASRSCTAVTSTSLPRLTIKTNQITILKLSDLLVKWISVCSRFTCASWHF